MAGSDDEYAIGAYGHKFEMDGEPTDSNGTHLLLSIAGKSVWVPFKVISRIFIRGVSMTVTQWMNRQGGRDG